MALNDSFDPATVSRDVAQTQAPLNEAVHVPGFIYNSETVFALEKDRLFMKEWVSTIREEQVANPGDYIAMRAMGEPFIVCRDNDGNINAFSNVCAHRGVEVASGECNLKEFSCPYHGWLYDIGGRCLEQPAEPTDSRYHERIRQTAYPCIERNGLGRTHGHKGVLFEHAKQVHLVLERFTIQIAPHVFTEELGRAISMIFETSSVVRSHDHIRKDPKVAL